MTPRSSKTRNHAGRGAQSVSFFLSFFQRVARVVLPHDVLCMGLTMFNASLLHYLPWGAGHVVVRVLTPRANPPQNPKIGSRARHVMWCTSRGTRWTFFPGDGPSSTFWVAFIQYGWSPFNGTCRFRHSNSIHFQVHG